MLEYFPHNFLMSQIYLMLFSLQRFFLYFTVMKGCITCDLYLLLTWTSSLLHFSLNQF